MMLARAEICLKMGAAAVFSYIPRLNTTERESASFSDSIVRRRLPRIASLRRPRS